MADVSKIGANGIEYDVCDTAARLGVQTANTNISSLRDDLTNDEADIANLQSDMTTAQGDITSLQSADTSLQMQINALKNTSASGYCKYADGTLIQWGTHSSFTLVNGVLTGVVQMNSSYPFINTSYSVMLTPGRNCLAYITGLLCEGNQGGNITRTQTTFAVSAKGTNTNITINWLAVGRWK